MRASWAILLVAAACTTSRQAPSAHLACPPERTACDPWCVDLSSDRFHCGECEHACGAGETCTRGVCCKEGEALCRGACTDLDTSDESCGACGLACAGATPRCSLGRCVACNPKVLLVMDGVGSQNEAFAEALRRSGMRPRLVMLGIELYRGEPPAGDFGAIVVSGGNASFANMDMPAAGQAAIVRAQALGAGVVLVEPLQWATRNNRMLRTLSALFLANGERDAHFHDRGPPWPAFTKTADHPIWAGLQTPLSLEPIDFADVVQGSVSRGATEIAQCSAAGGAGGACDGVGVVLVRTAPGGRVAHFNATVNDGEWSKNEALLRMMVNATAWAAGCSLPEERGDARP